MRRKLQLRSTTPQNNLNKCKPEVSNAIVGILIPDLAIPIIAVNKPVWIILARSFEGVPGPWHCNLLKGGSRKCPQRGGVHIIGNCFIEECGLLTEEMHNENFEKHLQVEFIPGSFYVSLQTIVLHKDPILVSGLPSNGRLNKIIDMRSIGSLLKGSSAKEKK